MNKDKKVVFLKADKDDSYGYIISVLDVVKKAGVETVGMVVDQKKKE
jgi:biopolymer transport protein TolR